jgi:3-phenylpropionate/trans-cinnamate dioxygenase ferredoxin reductase subunit
LPATAPAFCRHVGSCEAGRTPLERVLGTQLGALIGAIHHANGVRLLDGTQVAGFAGTERLDAVVLADGERVACDVAVLGVGIDPDVPAGAGAAMARDPGIVVDEWCRTSVADVYAAGDVANHLHPVLGRVRVEHCNSAERHGAAAARSMLGGDPAWEPDSEMAACARLVARHAHPDRGALTDERADLRSLMQ